MNILIASDGSAGARAALDAVISWPVHPEDTFAVASVSPTQPVLSGSAGAARHHTYSEEFPILAAEIAGNEADRLLDAGHEAYPVVLTGDPAVAIPRYAEEKQFDLIVLGAQGTGAVGHFQLGSVAQRVAHHAPCSVLAVRPPAGNVQSVMLATDGSRPSFDAAEQLARMPAQPGLAVHILYVLPQPATQIVIDDPDLRNRMAALSDELHEEFESVAESVCDETADHLALSGIDSQTVVVSGKPAEQIISYAEEANIDLIVVGDQSRPDLASSLLGSVALAVLKGAPCSVLVGRNAASPPDQAE